MAKRPQQPQIQIPDVSTSVQATPVNTFVAPGKAGMPTAPVSVPMPVQASNQSVVDMQNLAQSFGMLSNAIGRLGQAEARGDNAMSEWGERQAELVDLEATKKGYGLAFAEGVSKGAMEALEHPAAAAALSKGIMLRLNRDADLEMDAGFDKESVSNPNFTDPLYMESKFDKQTQEVMDKLPPGIPRPDVAIDTWIKARSKSRAIFKAKHDKWLSNRAIEDAELSLKEGVTREVDETMIMEPNPKVIGNTAKGFPIFVKESEKELEARKLASLTATISDQLDGAKGGLFTPKVNNEIVGMFLVDMARESNDPEKAALILKALRSAQTGPPGNRGKLNSGKTKIYHDKHLDSIERNIARGRAALSNAEFKQQIKDFEDRVVEDISSMFIDPNKLTTEEQVKQQIYDYVLGSDFAKDGGDWVAERTSNGITFTSKTGAANPVNLPVAALIKRSQEVALARDVEEQTNIVRLLNEKTGLGLSEKEIKSRGEAMSAAMNPDLHNKALQAEISNIPFQINSFRRMMINKQEPTDEQFETAGELLNRMHSTYETLRSTGVDEKYFSGDAKAIIEAVDIIIENPELFNAPNYQSVARLLSQIDVTEESDIEFLRNTSEWNKAKESIDFSNVVNAPRYSYDIEEKALLIARIYPSLPAADVFEKVKEHIDKDMVEIGGVIAPKKAWPEFVGSELSRVDRGGLIGKIAYELSGDPAVFSFNPIEGAETKSGPQPTGELEKMIRTQWENVKHLPDAGAALWEAVSTDKSFAKAVFDVWRSRELAVINNSRDKVVPLTITEILPMAADVLMQNKAFLDENGIAAATGEFKFIPNADSNNNSLERFELRSIVDGVEISLTNPDKPDGYYYADDILKHASKFEEAPGYLESFGDMLASMYLAAESGTKQLGNDIVEAGREATKVGVEIKDMYMDIFKDLLDGRF